MEEARGLPLRPYLKKELAQMVGLSAGYLWREIHANADLMRRLGEAGYKKRQKVLTVAQAQIIAEHYGVMP